MIGTHTCPHAIPTIAVISSVKDRSDSVFPIFPIPDYDLVLDGGQTQVSRRLELAQKT